jgi:hypothetical protein
MIRTGGNKWYEIGYNEVASTKFDHADLTYLKSYKKAEKLLKREVELHAQCKSLLQPYH